MHKPAYPHPLIAREGWAILAAAAVVALAVTLFQPWLSLPFWLFFLFALQFFRDPPREAPDGDHLVLCPADGRVVAVEETIDPYRDHLPALKVSVFMNVFNVHSNRAPVAGDVRSVAHFRGRFFNAALDKASQDNERCALILEMPDAVHITVVQIAGLVARRILCHAKRGQTLHAGQRYGFIRFGSRVDVYLPLHCRVRVALGDKVRATTTVLAELLPAPEASAHV